MIVKSFTFNPFQTNCFILHDSDEAAIIDPACMEAAEVAAVNDYIKRQGLEVRHLLLTHAHIDHIFGCASLSETYGMPFAMHRADLPFIDRSEEQARMFGIDLERPRKPETFLDEGDEIKIGSTTLSLLHVPGHSPGSIAFVDSVGRQVIAGDVLFSGSIGRTDLPGGSLPQLMESIYQKLVPLGDDFRVHCGHGPSTTIGQERRSNPFLTGGWG
jgi:hydroxyacylglutathione hydrolase